MAVRLEKAFGADRKRLLDMQAAHDRQKQRAGEKEVAVRARPRLDDTCPIGRGFCIARQVVVVGEQLFKRQRRYIFRGPGSALKFA
jgi:hypothetical protein